MFQSIIVIIIFDASIFEELIAVCFWHNPIVFW